MDLLSKFTGRGKDECLDLLYVDVDGLENGDGAVNSYQLDMNIMSVCATNKVAVLPVPD